MAQKQGDRIVHLEGQLSFLDGPADEPAPPVVAAAPSTVVEPDVAATPEPAVEPVTGPVITGPNTRVRAANAMERGRAAALAGAIDAIAAKGLRALTMADVADRSGLARATLYNHVRDKQSLVEALLRQELTACAAAADAATTLADALVAAAAFIAEHRALQGLRAHEPQALVALLNPGDDPAWEQGRAAIAATLQRFGMRATAADIDLVLRWMLSFVPAPSTADTRRTQGQLLLGSLVPDARH